MAGQVNDAFQQTVLMSRDKDATMSLPVNKVPVDNISRNTVKPLTQTAHW